jgi:hypothetical protein
LITTKAAAIGMLVAGVILTGAGIASIALGARRPRD